MKIGLLITARLKSSRLPFKLLMDLNGRSIIQRVIDRAKLIQGVDEIVLCTSTNPQDSPLAKEAARNNILYYLGSEEDVLQRLVDAAKFYNLDYILSITGENPLFSIEYANRVVDNVKTTNADFIFFDGLPIGCAVSAIKVKALQVVCEVKKEVDTEIWGPLINRPDMFHVVSSRVDEFFFRPQLRITNDYLEDYMFLNKIFSHFSTEAIPSLFSALTILDQHPEYLKIHAHRVQLALSPEKVAQIDSYYKTYREMILKTKEKIYQS
jgi:spore coat polysaccharide biosynthesis protein SpsF